MGQRLTYWIFLGAIGFAVFLLLQSSVDFNAGAPIKDSRTTLEGKTVELADRLGFSMDSLNMLSTRTQHLNYYRVLKDSLNDALPAPQVMNSQGLHLTGWDVVIGSVLDEKEFFEASNDQLFEKVGRLRLQYDNEGKIRRIKANPDNVNPSFVAGDSLFPIAHHIVNDIFDYDLSHYDLSYVDIKDSLISIGEPGFKNQPFKLSDTNVGNTTIFRWKKGSLDFEGPEELMLEVKPMIRELDNDQSTRIAYGASIDQFEALDKNEPEMLSHSSIFNNLNFVIIFGSLFILIILVFFSGIKHINQGQVEWKRAIFILISVSLGIMGWRAIYMINTFDSFFNDAASLVFFLNTSLFAAACGLYAALAYIGWEANARSNNQEQLHLIDAYWKKRFFFRETGDGLLRGYALGGVMLGLFALMVYLMDTVYYQHDSQFGFLEPSLQPKLLTINMSTWINAWLVALGHVAIPMGMLQNNLKRKWLFYLAGILLLGFLLGGSAAFIAVEGPIWYDVIIFTCMAPAVIFAFDKAGLLTFSAGWWLFAVVLLITPYWGSSSLDVAYVAWVQGFVILLPVIYGFIAYRYGESVSELGGYIPEYQERIANHLRVEKEIEIARESQFKLMPLRPPSLQGIDVYGFFMPSFEVGGDYFDYVINRNGSTESEKLVMTIADVSGKSMKAAMHAVFTSGLLLSRLHRDAPQAILQEVAPTLYMRTDPQTFITCIIAQYDLKTRQLVISNAGHCLPILKRDSKACFMRTPDPRYPLGLRTEVNYQSLETELEPGDFLLLYSDGLPEAVDPEGNRFGYDTMLELVESLDTDTKTSNEIALEIKRQVQKFSDYQLADDTTIICLKV